MWKKVGYIVIYRKNIYYGVSRFFINLIRDNNAKIENLFEGFKILNK